MGLRKYISFFVATTLLAFCLPAAAQEKWSLDKCIGHAMEYNLQLKQMQQDKEIAQNNVTQSKLEYIPSVNASMGHNMSWGRSVNLNDLEIVENKLSQSSSLNISASLPLFEGFRRKNTVESNKISMELAQANIEALENDISLTVVRSFLQVLLAKEIEATALRSCQAAAEQVEKTATMVEAGSQPYSALLEVKSQLANENVQLTTARNNTSATLLELAHVMGITHPKDFDIEIPSSIEDEILPLKSEDVSDIFNRTVQLQPSVRKSEISLQQSQTQLKIQKGAALPTLSISAGYGTYYSDSQNAAFFTQFNNNRNPSVGLSLSIPVFNNWRNSTAVKNARSSVRKSEIGQEMAHQELLKQISTAYNEALGGYEKLMAAKANKDAAGETFNHTSEKFNLGMLSGTDYTAAKNNLLKAESEYIQSKYQYLFQKKILDFYKLVPLTL